MIVGLILREQIGTGGRTCLDQSVQDQPLGPGVDFSQPGCGHKSFARLGIDHRSASWRAGGLSPQRRWRRRCDPGPRGRFREWGEWKMPRRDLPIVHIVPDGAIRKFMLKEGIVGES